MNDSKEGRWRGMGVGLGGCGTEDHGNLADKRVREEEEGKNCGLCSRDTDKQNL